MPERHLNVISKQTHYTAKQTAILIPTCRRQDIVELRWLLAATAGSVRVALSVPVPVPLLDGVSVSVAVSAGQSVGGDGPRGRRVAFDRARGPALLGGGVRGSPSHLGPVNHIMAKTINT